MVFCKNAVIKLQLNKLRFNCHGTSADTDEVFEPGCLWKQALNTESQPQLNSTWESKTGPI